MKNRYLFAFFLVFSFWVPDAKGQTSTVLSIDGKVAFTVTKANVSLLLSQKGQIINLSVNASGDIAYDIHHRIDQIGKVEVSYDIHDRINKIGDTDLSYDIHGRLDKIGPEAISYDLAGRVTRIGRTEISYRLSTGDIEKIKDL